MQSERFLGELGFALVETVLRVRLEAAKRGAPILVENATKYFVN